MSKRTKTGILLKIGGSVLVLFVVLILVVYFIDSKPPDDTHLTPVDSEVAGQNPLAAGSEFSQIEISFDHVEGELQNSTISGLLRGIGPWDGSLVEKALAPNRRGLRMKTAEHCRNYCRHPLLGSGADRIISFPRKAGRFTVKLQQIVHYNSRA
jgi:hypothetical protein